MTVWVDVSWPDPWYSVFVIQYDVPRVAIQCIPDTAQARTDALSPLFHQLFDHEARSRKKTVSAAILAETEIAAAPIT